MYHSLSIEAIVPVKDRVEVIESVRSLTSIDWVKRVIICDGGSTDSQCLEALNQLQQQPNVEILRFSEPGFNKSRLLNQGIRQATSDLLLISDADILWNEAALAVVTARVLSDTNIICSIQEVEESQPDSIALKRDRYTYHCTREPDVTIVEILPWPKSRDYSRPGCGLICTRRTTLIALGGYKELFTGWGWEDQDLLIRANLCGFAVVADGKVIHLSHPDKVRNQHYSHTQPGETRDRNIILSLQSLAEGILVGDLLTETIPQPQPQKIQLGLPDSLNQKFGRVN